MATAPAFDEYLAALGQLTGHIDPTASTPQAQEIRDTARELDTLEVVDRESLARWVRGNPTRVPVLGLTVGLSQERLKNVLRDRFRTRPCC